MLPCPSGDPSKGRGHKSSEFKIQNSKFTKKHESRN